MGRAHRSSEAKVRTRGKNQVSFRARTRDEIEKKGFRLTVSVWVTDNTTPLDLVSDEDWVNGVTGSRPNGQRNRDHGVDLSVSELDLSVLLPRLKVGFLSVHRRRSSEKRIRRREDWVIDVSVEGCLLGWRRSC